MSRKLRVGVLFGGRSGEHEVSLMSARSVLDAIDRDRFEVVPIGIAKDGRWLLSGDPLKTLTDGVARTGGKPIALLPGQEQKQIVPVGEQQLAPEGAAAAGAGLVDVVFPVLHGTMGEDGTIQGLLEIAGVPYVGAGVLGSAVGMDKDMMKTVFRAHGLPQARHVAVLRHRWEAAKQAGTEGRMLQELEDAFGYPCFVKPANLGSSVGISKAKDRDGLRAALDEAARYDRKIIVEEFIDGRELEVSVLGNDEPIASVVGEIVPSNEFYDYNAKYIDGTSGLIIPAELPEETAAEVRRLALAAFKVLDLSGMARVDFFLERGTGRVLLNEVNTLPGFTSISMYPKLWEASGLPYRDLITKLIELALERHADRQRSLDAIADA